MGNKGTPASFPDPMALEDPKRLLKRRSLQACEQKGLETVLQNALYRLRRENRILHCPSTRP